MNTISSGNYFNGYSIESTKTIQLTKLSQLQNGIDVSNATAIDLSQYKIEKFADLPKLSEARLNPENPQLYRSRLVQQGQVEQTGIIREHGKIVGSISSTGITAFNNSIGAKISASGLSGDSDIDSIQSFLKEQFGGTVTVEKFSLGTGPSYEEVHNSVYEISYKSLVAKQTLEQQIAYNNSTNNHFVSISV